MGRRRKRSSGVFVRGENLEVVICRGRCPGAKIPHRSVNAAIQMSAAGDASRDVTN